MPHKMRDIGPYRARIATIVITIVAIALLSWMVQRASRYFWVWHKIGVGVARIDELNGWSSEPDGSDLGPKRIAFQVPGLPPKVTDRDLLELSDSLHAMPKLESIDLSRTGVTDAGLVALYGLKSVRRLDLRETSVSEEGVKKLTETLPSLQHLNVTTTTKKTRFGATTTSQGE